MSEAAKDAYQRYLAALPPREKGAYVHKGDCQCWWCETEDLPPKYLRIRRSS